MKMIGEILTAEQIADLASIMPNAGNAILELTEDQLDLLKGYIKSCKILNKSSRTEKMLALCQACKHVVRRGDARESNLLDAGAGAAGGVMKNEEDQD